MTQEPSIPDDIFRMMSFKWMGLKGPNLQKCQLIHSGSCSLEIAKKFVDVLKIGAKYYALIHLVPFLLKLRKRRSDEPLKQVVIKSSIKFIRSLLFMACLVSGLKAGLCCCGNLSHRTDSKALTMIALPTSLSILFEERSRRDEIINFALIRAIRSMYIYLKKRNLFSFANQMQICFILIFGFISLVNFQYPDLLKYQHTLNSIWGNP